MMLCTKFRAREQPWFSLLQLTRSTFIIKYLLDNWDSNMQNFCVQGSSLNVNIARKSLMEVRRPRKMNALSWYNSEHLHFWWTFHVTNTQKGPSSTQREPQHPTLGSWQHLEFYFLHLRLPSPGQLIVSWIYSPLFTLASLIFSFTRYTLFWLKRNPCDILPLSPTAASERMNQLPFPRGSGAVHSNNNSGRKIQELNISKDYVKGWDTTDAFREFYQNW